MNKTHILAEPGTLEAIIDLTDREAEAFHINTQMELEQPPQPTLIRMVGNAVISHAEGAGRLVYKKAGNFALNVRDELELAVFDSLKGTDLRTQRRTKREQARIAKKAAKFALQ